MQTFATSLPEILNLDLQSKLINYYSQRCLYNISFGYAQFNSILQLNHFFTVPSSRRQKAREKRSRQSDVMSDIESLDVMLGNFQQNDQVSDETASEADFDLESRRRQGGFDIVGGHFRTLFNTNTSEMIEITADTSRAFNSEISSQMSRKLEEKKSDLNSHIVYSINSALEEMVIPSIKSAREGQNSAKTTNLDLRSDGPHPSNFGQVRTQRDSRSNGLLPEKISQVVQDAQKDFPRLVATGSNRIHHGRENSVYSNHKVMMMKVTTVIQSMCLLIVIMIPLFIFIQSDTGH